MLCVAFLPSQTKGCYFSSAYVRGEKESQERCAQAHGPLFVHLNPKFLVRCCSPSNRFVCARQLRSVRKQFNEYETMKYTLLYMTITLASFVGLVLFLLADDLVVQRRLAIFCELHCTTRPLPPPPLPFHEPHMQNCLSMATTVSTFSSVQCGKLLCSVVLNISRHRGTGRGFAVSVRGTRHGHVSHLPGLLKIRTTPAAALCCGPVASVILGVPFLNVGRGVSKRTDAQRRNAVRISVFLNNTFEPLAAFSAGWVRHRLTIPYARHPLTSSYFGPLHSCPCLSE